MDTEALYIEEAQDGVFIAIDGVRVAKILLERDGIQKVFRASLELRDTFAEVLALMFRPGPGDDQPELLAAIARGERLVLESGGSSFGDRDEGRVSQ